ncbi:uncharacterized protein LOC143212356 [Lasioglossum baleicum]|uniref:uncharacterized protein LOC143212356 n=1 Tax=Lasioglossum baleicum TaxID=434251 RepID=UPI003FCEC27C
MDDESLIECIRKNECLYNSEHPKYMDGKYKGIVWSEIGEEMGQPVALCKNRWQNIRDSYRKYLTRCNARNTPNGKKHKYRDALLFLTPYFHYQGETNSGLADSMGERSKANNEPSRSNNGVEESEQPPPPPPPPPTPPPPPPPPPLPRKRSRCNLEEEEALEIWENRIAAYTEAIEQLLQQYTETQREPSLRLFFESVIMSVSRLKRRNQTIVQQEVLQIISEFLDAEEKEET